MIDCYWHSKIGGYVYSTRDSYAEGLTGAEKVYTCHMNSLWQYLN